MFYFNNTDPEGGKCLGYIAEEVDELHSRFASHSQENGKPIAIDYNAIIVFMVEEVAGAGRTTGGWTR